MFVVKLLGGNYSLPGLAYFWWFVYYYGFVLCASGLINISSFVIQMFSFRYTDISIEECRPFNLSDEFQYGWVFPFFLIFTYVLVFGTAFCMDALVSQILALKENVHPLRNLMHFLSAQVVLWVYCLVEYRAIILIAIYGKAVCGHKASEKSALVGKADDKATGTEKGDEGDCNLETIDLDV